MFKQMVSKESKEGYVRFGITKSHAEFGVKKKKFSHSSKRKMNRTAAVCALFRFFSSKNI